MSHLSTFRQQLLCFGMLVGSASQVLAQTTPADTTRLSYSEETVTTPAAADTLLRVQQEDRSLWKLSLNNFTTSADRYNPSRFYTRYGVPIAYERRLGQPAWSVLGEVSPGIIRYRPEAGASLKRGLEVQTQLAGRYYYNLERRLRLGRNTTHFSANYVSVALKNQFGPRRDYAKVQALYGLQRRLGRFGFMDFNFGPASTVSDRRPDLYLAVDFRIGLALSSLPAAPYRARVVPVGEDNALRPRVYVGLAGGAYRYQTNYSSTDVYRTPPTHVLGQPEANKAGVGRYELVYDNAYYYAGYYMRPRLAVQVGMQQANSTSNRNTYDAQRDSLSGVARERGVAFPLLVRYSLTRPFLKRVQFDAMGGLVPAWSWVRYQEQRFSRGEATGNYGFQRRSFGLHAAWGLDISYGFGRRRRVQLNWETLIITPLQNSPQREEHPLASGTSIGLRYRFGYR